MLTRRHMMQGLVASAAGASLAALIGPEGSLAQTIAKAKPLNLKITDVRVFNVAPRSTFVKLYTNQGLIGLGEAHQSGLEEAVSASVLLCKPLLIGKDPTAIESIWEEIYEGPR
jgi:L-alanine-DL-glutamate epimerase-like enolase superfamily enzyme